ncbi:MAG: hypothetical protein M1814_005815 [Vezdaea aestivalis]|nr:MAG: hypothetical protein M1814_005815 [Vezdaea aestivalis]
MERRNKPSAIPVEPSVPTPTADISSDNSSITGRLPTGETVTILLHGATVTSWKSASGAEHLWLSEKAILDGSKPVRGGIPLVFPVFGPPPKSGHPTSSLSQHGFARSSRWEYLGKSTSESKGSTGADDSIQLDFGLGTSEASKSWPYQFGLQYSVTLSAASLRTNLVVRNEGKEGFDFQCLLHTYLRVKDISGVSVKGLNAPFTEKAVSPPSTNAASAEPITIGKEVDRVYTSVPKDSTITVAEGTAPRFEITRENLDDVVVWNPWIEKSAGMGDFAPKDGYKTMLCVEAGVVKDWQKLEAGETFEGGQIIKAF